MHSPAGVWRPVLGVWGAGTGATGECGIHESWDGEMWHNQIVPRFAMVFQDRSHLPRGHTKYS